MSPLSLTYWGIPGYAIFWSLTALAFGIFFYRISRLIQYMFQGQKETGFSHLAWRALKTIAITLGQWCQLKGVSLKDRAGIGHALFAWGFSIFAVFYIIFIVVGAGFGLSETMADSSFFYYYTWIMDIVSPIVILAALWAIIRRYVIKPPRLQGEQTFEAMASLAAIVFIPATQLFKTAASIALAQPPAGLGTILPPVSSAMSNFFNGSSAGSVQAVYTGFFWAHWLVVLSLLGFIAYSRHLHMVASPFNIFFRSPLPKGALRSIDLDTAQTFGAARITDLTWKQVLDLYSCVVCGQCQDACPASASGKPLNPKKVIQDLKKHLLEVSPELLKARGRIVAPAGSPARTLAGGLIAKDEIWACTTCRACDEVCPLYVEHIDKIVDLRRNLVMEQASIPETAKQALRSIEDRGHPWLGATAARTDWAQGFDIKILAQDSQVDFLFWVGCTGALEERSIRVTQSLARILKLSGVNFGILGSQESCCGEPARRLGNEYLFQTQVKKNIEMIKSYDIKKIVTACPHCYNTLKNEYPGFGGEFEVSHHTEFIASLIGEGRLKITKATDRAITYHDPCYLGRYNEIFKPPRQILKRLPDVKLAEMENNRRKSFCCGGGGGRMWLEESTGRRISQMRIEQAARTRAHILATACPFCLQMLDDAIKARGLEDSLKALDIAELVAEAVKINQEGKA